MKTRFIIATSISAALFFGAATTLYKVAQPTISVSFQQPFDPTITTVLLNNTRLYPEGTGGVLYRGKGSFLGGNKLIIRGAYVQDQEIELEADPFSKKELSIKTTTRTVDDVVKIFSNDKDKQDTKVFENWIVSFIKGNQPYDEREALVLHYDRGEGIWLNKTRDITSQNTTVPEAVKNYILEFADD